MMTEGFICKLLLREKQIFVCMERATRNILITKRENEVYFISPPRALLIV